MGGEHVSTNVGDGTPDGSSPRGRGTPAERDVRRYLSRFIPAWAGNTCPEPTPANTSPVHPRVGGEHVSTNVGDGTPDGSSPRGRGTPAERDVRRYLSRFIPAWAGNTCPEPTPANTSPVHPRVGGEHGFGQPGVAQGVGSSPRGRGTRLRSRHDPQRNRFIPAWAGNTTRCSPAVCSITVHPRVGGEHSNSSRVIPHSSGSSPRGRGTPAPSRQRG